MTQTDYRDSSFDSISSQSAQRFDVACSDNVTIAAYELRDCPATAPALLWAHANGFSAGSYLPFLQLLSTRFRVFAYDVRGHGGSTAPVTADRASLNFDCFADDLRAVSEWLSARLSHAPLYFSGHSFSAATMFHLAGEFGYAPWQAVTTFDATMLPHDDSDIRVRAEQASVTRIERTLGRRVSWATITECAVTLGRPGVFDGWTSEMLQAHCHATLRPLRSGGVGLACQPEIEAGVYAGVMDTRPYECLPSFPVPAHLVGADPNCGGTWVGEIQPAAAARIAQSQYTCAAGASHLMVFEQPRWCAELVCSMLN